MKTIEIESKDEPTESDHKEDKQTENDTKTVTLKDLSFQKESLNEYLFNEDDNKTGDEAVPITDDTKDLQQDQEGTVNVEQVHISTSDLEGENITVTVKLTTEESLKQPDNIEESKDKVVESQQLFDDFIVFNVSKQTREDPTAILESKEHLHEAPIHDVENINTDVADEAVTIKTIDFTETENKTKSTSTNSIKRVTFGIQPVIEGSNKESKDKKSSNFGESNQETKTAEDVVKEELDNDTKLKSIVEDTLVVDALRSEGISKVEQNVDSFEETIYKREEHTKDKNNKLSSYSDFLNLVEREETKQEIKTEFNSGLEKNIIKSTIFENKVQVEPKKTELIYEVDFSQKPYISLRPEEDLIKKNAGSSICIDSEDPIVAEHREKNKTANGSEEAGICTKCHVF